LKMSLKAWEKENHRLERQERNSTIAIAFTFP
jgi:hypothetical protein